VTSVNPTGRYVDEKIHVARNCQNIISGTNVMILKIYFLKRLAEKSAFKKII
jgi:hypothetical protein